MIFARYRGSMFDASDPEPIPEHPTDGACCALPVLFLLFALSLGGLVSFGLGWWQ